jgi:hypothetical protein
MFVDEILERGLWRSSSARRSRGEPISARTPTGLAPATFLTSSLEYDHRNRHVARTAAV